MEENCEDAISFLMPFQEGKKNTENAARIWLLEHGIEFRRFIEDTYSNDSLPDAKTKFFDEDPFLGVQMTHSHSLPNFMKINALKCLLKGIKYGDILFLGFYQTGKTVTMFQFAKWLSELGREVVWFGPPRNLPDFVNRSTVDLYDIKVGEVVIYDEAGVKQFSRNAMTRESREAFENIGTVSHQSQLWLKAVQSASLTDKMNIRLPQMIVAKTMTPAQLEHEREYIKKLRDWIPFTMKKSLTFIANQYIPHVKFLVDIPLPDWWQDEFSILYRMLETREEAMEYAQQLLYVFGTNQDGLKKIQTELRRLRFKIGVEELIRELGIEG